MKQYKEITSMFLLKGLSILAIAGCFTTVAIAGGDSVAEKGPIRDKIAQTKAKEGNKGPVTNKEIVEFVNGMNSVTKQEHQEYQNAIQSLTPKERKEVHIPDCVGNKGR